MSHSLEDSRLVPRLRQPKTRWRPDKRHRPLPERETCVVRRLDTTAPSARPRYIDISLWRIRAGENLRVGEKLQ